MVFLGEGVINSSEDWYFWNKVPNIWEKMGISDRKCCIFGEKTGISGAKCQIFGRKLVFWIGNVVYFERETGISGRR